MLTPLLRIHLNTTVLAIVLILGLSVPLFSSGAPVGSTRTCDSLLDAACAGACPGTNKSCGLAIRLKRFVSWLGEKDKPCSTRVNDLNDRVRALQDTQRFTIDTSIVTFVGTVGAPVRIVMYVSASCPLCKRIYHDLYDSVTLGCMKGKARLGIKPFSSKPWDLALLASRKFNRQADLIRSLAGVTERISLAIILDKADSLGIPRKEFQKEIDNPGVKVAAEASYREAVQNGVTITPTIFINGCRYKSYKDPQWVVDAADYFYERRSVKR
jgi:glutaredoxin